MYCFAPQCGHLVCAAALRLIYSCTLFFKYFSPSSSRFLRSSIYFFLSSSEIFSLPHTLQVVLKYMCMCLAKLTWITGLASSMCPKCPGHESLVLPQTGHTSLGSIAPSLRSIGPPSMGIPSLSYTSLVIIAVTLIFLISSGERIPNLIPVIRPLPGINHTPLLLLLLDKLLQVLYS